MARTKSTATTATEKADLKHETTYFYRGWSVTRSAGESSPWTLPLLAAIDRWHAGKGEPEPEIAAAGVVKDISATRGMKTIDSDDTLLEGLLGEHPDALCFCGQPRKTHAPNAAGALVAEECSGFEHDQELERCENCYKPLLIADEPYLDDDRCSACSPKAALEAAAPKPVEPANAAGDEHAEASLTDRNLILSDLADLKHCVEIAAMDEKSAERRAENSKGPLLTFAGEEWVSAELEATKTAWLEIEDMKALERLKARHGLLTEMRISRASVAANAVLANAKKAHEDARAALQVFQQENALFLGGTTKTAPAASPSARADASTPSPTSAATIMHGLKPTLEPALAKAAAEGAAEAAKAAPPSVAAQKLAAFVAAPASVPMYPERLLLDLAVAGFSWIGTVEQARKATETAVRDALVGYQGAKRSRRRGEALEALGWVRRAADPVPESTEAEIAF